MSPFSFEYFQKCVRIKINELETKQQQTNKEQQQKKSKQRKRNVVVNEHC